LRSGPELWKHEELAELQAGDCGAPAELGDVVLVAASDALDEAVHAQAFELPGLLLARDLESLAQDVYTDLTGQVAEVKRMLYRFMQSLSSGPDADR
jgi:hypothetical protein